MKKYVVTFVIGLLLLGIGCGYFTFEVLDFEYIDTVNPQFHLENVVKEYDIGKQQRYEFDLYHGSLRFVVDDTLRETMEVTIQYPQDYFAFDYQEVDMKHYQVLTYKFLERHTKQVVKNAFDVFIHDMSHKTFYNYEKTFTPTVEIRVSEDNLKYIDYDHHEVKVWE